MRQKRGRYRESTGWSLNGNGVVSRWFRERKRKEIGKRQGENKMKIGHSQVNNSVILRISYVYVTYILRIWYVIDSGKEALIQISCNVFQLGTFLSQVV